METKKDVRFERIFAAFIDFSLFQLLWTLSVLLTTPIVGWEAFIEWIVEGEIGITDEMTAAYAAYTIVSALLGAIIGILYYAYVPLIKDGKTFGKTLMGVKAIDSQGQNPSVLKHMLRAIMLWGVYVVTPLSFLILADVFLYTILTSMASLFFYTFAFAALLMIIFRSDNRGPHDLLAETRVVDENFEPSWEMVEPALRREDWAAKETVNRQDDFLRDYDARDPWKR